MKRFVRWLALCSAALALAALGGCASTSLLDNQVQTFSSLAGLPAQPTYRFERLPSQQSDPGQAPVETMAAPALARAGLRRDDAAPRYSVQVSARVMRRLSPYADPWTGWGFGWSLGWHSRGLGLGFGGPFPRYDQTWMHREVSVILRELATNRVVYETHAVNDGPWLDDRAVLPAMFQAAMQGFPNPPAGPRRVDIQLGQPGG